MSNYTTTTPGWELGKWLIICQRCGFKRTSDDIIRESWTNLLVCKDTCNDGARHPQEFVRPRADDQSVPYTNTEPTDQFVDVTYADVGPSGDIPTGTFNTMDTINE